MSTLSFLFPCSSLTSASPVRTFCGEFRLEARDQPSGTRNKRDLVSVEEFWDAVTHIFNVTVKLFAFQPQLKQHMLMKWKSSHCAWCSALLFDGDAVSFDLNRILLFQKSWFCMISLLTSLAHGLMDSCRIFWCTHQCNVTDVFD